MTDASLKKEPLMLNTPNILSILRLCLVPVFVVVYFSGIPSAMTWAAGIYAAAVLTDFLDGYIARRYNQITNLGKVLDPLGDKMFIFASLSCMSITEHIPYWVLIVYTVKEISMGLGGLLIHRRARIEIPPSNLLGKVATCVFFGICMILLIFEPDRRVSTFLMTIAIAFSLSAFFSYIYRFISIMRNRKNDDSFS